MCVEKNVFSYARKYICMLKGVNARAHYDKLTEVQSSLRANLPFLLVCEFQQESDVNGPSLTLPSISEDDENVVEEGESSPLSPPNKSPLHASSSPRHAKFR